MVQLVLMVRLLFQLPTTYAGDTLESIYSFSCQQMETQLSNSTYLGSQIAG